MEGSNLKGLVDEEIGMKMGKAAGIGLAFGGVYGALNSMLHDGPQYGSNVKYPQLIRTTKRLVRRDALTEAPLRIVLFALRKMCDRAICRNFVQSLELFPVIVHLRQSPDPTISEYASAIATRVSQA